jgi:glycosyltransferase involved in cell wall biosynthesis
VPGRTGLLVPESDPRGLARALREDLSRFDSDDIRAHAQSFSRARFQARLRTLVEETCANASAGDRS